MSDLKWWKGAVFYQIYPRSYMDSNGDGIGDLAGITDRIKHIADLGVEGIWISPFFKSPMADFGYDVSDYRSVDPLFGTNEDFDILLRRAHDLGLKIIVDMVLSHTSIEHPWFVESRLSADNRKADWYVWADAKPDGSPPNNWQSCFSGPAWTFDTRRGQYYLHNFLKEQPDLNFHNPEVQKHILSECEYWLERGVDGFRLDVANFYFHDKLLRDNPPKKMNETVASGVQFEKPYPYIMQRHLHDKSQPENLEFLKKLRALMDKYPDKMSLGEIGDDDPFQLAVQYTKNCYPMHTCYSTHLMSGTGSTELKTGMITGPIQYQLNCSKETWPSWAFGNHDVVRPVTRWGKNIKDKAAFAKLLTRILLSLQGTVFMFQGEELGLNEARIAFEDIQDPWGKAMWPEWQGRDGCRTPMPWVKEAPHAGFTDNPKPWLPIPHDHIERAVNVQETDPDSVLNDAKNFIAWRKKQPVLRYGDIEFLDTGDDKILGFIRTHEGKSATCLFNISEEQRTYDGKILPPLSAHFIGL